MESRTRWCLIPVAILLFVTSWAYAQQQDVLTPEMVVSLRSASQVAISPDGKQIAYVLRVPREEADDPGPSYSEIWMVSTKGGQPRQFTSKPVSSWSPQWSPDGRTLAFLSRREAYHKQTQVYLIPADGGEARRLTESETGVSQFRWSPDGQWIAYTARDPEPEEVKKAKKAGKDWKVAEKYDRHTRLWVINVATGESRQVTQADLTVWSFAWAPDSKRLLIQASEEPDTDSSYLSKRLYTVAASGGEPKLLCETEGKLGDMAWSPDGGRIAFLGAVDLNDPTSGSLFVVSADGGEANNLTVGYEGTATDVAWRDRNTIAFVAIEGTTTSLNLIPARGGKITKVVTGGPIFSSISFAKDARTFATAASTPSHPPEVFSGSLESKRLTRLTTSNPELQKVRLAQQEVIRWKSVDGMEIEGILVKPLDYEPGKRYPLVLQLHGGPEGVDLNGWTTSYGYPVQLLAARGYMVLKPNYRGSSGRGVAFSKADHKDLGGKEFEDVLAGIDYLDQQGMIDSKRVGTGGWSYGGYFSAWAATRYSDRFAAAVICAAIGNWMSFTGTTDIPREMSLVHWALLPYDDPQLAWERSPLAYIKNAKTPSLVVHGEKDLRVPPSQGWEIYRALKHAGVETELVTYPREPHGLRERAHQLDFIKRALDWFDRYLKKVGTS
jgi:dipeptidyl aminopeptidase/acylaminoacyl peptidase